LFEKPKTVAIGLGSTGHTVDEGIFSKVAGSILGSIAFSALEIFETGAFALTNLL